MSNVYIILQYYFLLYQELPLYSCLYQALKIYAQYYYAVNAQSIAFECQRLWQNEDIKEISFDLTWILPQYLQRGNVISSLIVELKLMDMTENSTILIGTTSIAFSQVHYILTLANYGVIIKFNFV